MIIQTNAKKLKFVIHNHYASKHHFDLRLQKPSGEKMWSFAIPKHKLPKGNDKLLAVKVDDHPLSYAKFEGEIKDGYGKGKVDIYDEGEYKIIEKNSEKIEFQLIGKKVNGIFTLIKTDMENKWFLIKNTQKLEAKIKTKSSYGAHELESYRIQDTRKFIFFKLESKIGYIIDAVKAKFKTDFEHDIRQFDYINKFIEKYLLENTTEVLDCVKKGTIILLEYNFHKLLDNIIKYVKENWENRIKIFEDGNLINKHVYF